MLHAKLAKATTMEPPTTLDRLRQSLFQFKGIRSLCQGIHARVFAFLLTATCWRARQWARARRRCV